MQQGNNIPISVTVIPHAHITDIQLYVMLHVWFTSVIYNEIEDEPCIESIFQEYNSILQNMYNQKICVLQKTFGVMKTQKFIFWIDDKSYHFKYNHVNMNTATVNWPAIQWISCKLSALLMSVSVSSSDQYQWPLISSKPTTTSIKAKPHGDKASIWKCRYR